MRPTFVLSLLLPIAVLAGCASTSRVMIAPPRPAIPAEQVRVYFAPPDARYQEIAILETASGPLTYGEQNKMDAVLAKLRRAAAELGANGVLLQESGNAWGGGGVGVGLGGGTFGGHTHVGGGVGVNISPSQKHARALAIYVDAPAAGPPLSPRAPAD